MQLALASIYVENAFVRFIFLVASKPLNSLFASTQVINLVGPTSQQDVEIAALYRDATLAYGDGKVLGIVAHYTHEQRQHQVRKRAAEEKEKPTTTASPETAVVDEKAEEDCIYRDPGRK